MNKHLVLCILDGCGYREESDGNAFKNANKPTYNMLESKLKDNFTIGINDDQTYLSLHQCLHTILPFSRLLYLLFC